MKNQETYWLLVNKQIDGSITKEEQKELGKLQPKQLPFKKRKIKLIDVSKLKDRSYVD